jgi:putative ABC transport system permease protein
MNSSTLEKNAESDQKAAKILHTSAGIDLFENIRVALTALRTNLLRSILTTLGIVIGVAAVILMMALGNAAREQVIGEIESFGSNVLVLIPQADTRGGGRVQRAFLTERDARALQRQVQGIDLVSPQVRTSVQVVFETNNNSTTLIGANTEYLELSDWNVVSGRMFTAAEVNTAAKVAVIGDRIRENLFGDVDPVGSIIRVNKTPLLIIGLLEPKGGGGLGPDQDDVVLAPITTARRRVGVRSPGPPDSVQSIQIRVEERDELARVMEDVTELMRARRNIGATDLQDFRIFSPQELAESLGRVLGIFALVLAGIASISLLVGGIGIMNIMLVSVTERTREIGLRMALGARPRDIQRQFLVESVVLCLIGGALGLALGAGGAALAAQLMDAPATVGLGTMAMAVGVSALIGVGFGYFPARRAAKLNPIEALRHE